MSLAVAETKNDGRPVVRRWTAEDYSRAAEAGVFGPEERLELINGEIYRMSPQNASHSTVVGLVGDALQEAFQGRYFVRIQMPLCLAPSSLPEPDVCVVPGSRRDYQRHHPADATLVVEVADSSVTFDLETKSVVYANGGIQEYWVILIPERVLVTHRDPDPQSGTYRQVMRLHEGDTISPLAAPAAALSISDLLP